MRLSRRSEYGLRALIDLTRHRGEGPIPLTELAARNNLPRKFLEQILITLRNGGIVQSAMGSRGGYQLAPGAERTSLARVIRMLDGALAPLDCASLLFYERCSCPDEATCALREVMIDVRDGMLAILEHEMLAGTAARSGTASIDPRGIHGEVLAGRVS